MLVDNQPAPPKQPRGLIFLLSFPLDHISVVGNRLTLPVALKQTSHGIRQQLKCRSTRFIFTFGVNENLRAYTHTIYVVTRLITALPTRVKSYNRYFWYFLHTYPFHRHTIMPTMRSSHHGLNMKKHVYSLYPHPKRGECVL